MSDLSITGTKGYTTPLLGGLGTPSDGGTASAIRGRKEELEQSQGAASSVFCNSVFAQGQ